MIDPFIMFEAEGLLEKGEGTKCCKNTFSTLLLLPRKRSHTTQAILYKYFPIFALAKNSCTSKYNLLSFLLYLSEDR